MFEGRIGQVAGTLAVKGLFLIIAGALLWACDGPFRYPLLSEGGLSAETIVFYEHLLLVLIFLPSLIRDVPKFLSAGPIHLGYLLILGVGGAALATLCYTRAFSLLNPSLVIILQKLQPLVAVLLAKVFLQEPISRRFVLWGFICLGGVLLISYHDLQVIWQQLHHSSLFQLAYVQGYLYTLMAVLGWGSATVLSKKLILLGYCEKQIMGGRYLFACLALIPVMAMGGHSFTVTPPHLVQIALMAIISGLLGAYLYYRGLRRVSARVCTLGELFYPLGAVLINWIFLDLAIHPIQIMGGGILFLGITMIQIKRY